MIRRQKILNLKIRKNTVSRECVCVALSLFDEGEMWLLSSFYILDIPASLQSTTRSRHDSQNNIENVCNTTASRAHRSSEVKCERDEPIDGIAARQSIRIVYTRSSFSKWIDPISCSSSFIREEKHTQF